MRIALDPDPLAETANSVRVLQRRDQASAYGPWRALVRSRFSRETMGPLLDLLPPDAPIGRPEFLTTVRGTRTLDEGLARLRAEPERIAAELASLGSSRPLPDWMRGLAEADRAALDRMNTAFRAYHDIAVAPFWQRISAAVHGEIAIRRRIMAEQGVEGLLATLHPSVRWHSPVLEIPSADAAEIRLDGQGLLLAPSFFLWPNVDSHRSCAAHDQPLQLAFPVALDAASFRTTVRGMPTEGDTALPSLLGRTRAAALEAIATGTTTSELGRRLGVTPAAASQHAAVLRAAGLVITRRQGSSVLHSITPLGTELVGGCRPSADLPA
ncbi:winged helix-turn-helix domain-containing protein [Kitasatospora sp. NPDC005856]|uniref:ArsR/SmtB family transcription factor n=1 Tax=Kitasatospora sp. NPDC005856 TaxID=3154566 RepID=UPI0033F9F275